MRMNIPMVKKNSKGIACNIRLMIYLPMSASDKQEVGTANVGHSVPYFLQLCNYLLTCIQEILWLDNFTSIQPEVSNARMLQTAGGTTQLRRLQGRCRCRTTTPRC